MADNVVNLNRFRKQKQREDRARQGEINRAKHGRTKAEKERATADRERGERTLDSAHLEPEIEAPTAPAAETSDEND